MEMPCTPQLWFCNRDIFRLLNVIFGKIVTETLMELSKIIIKFFGVPYIFLVGKRYPADFTWVNNIGCNKLPDIFQGFSQRSYGFVPSFSFFLKRFDFLSLLDHIFFFAHFSDLWFCITETHELDFCNKPHSCYFNVGIPLDCDIGCIDFFLLHNIFLSDNME